MPSVIVAGTNGKGSSATLLAGVYRAAGYRTGLYTSPHLLRYNERVVIDGEPVADSALCEAFSHIDAARGDISLTYFEFGTLAALWLFAQAGVDVQVLEIGLGGRLDAVNIVDAEAALLTNVGLDHQDWLGPDRESIGREKAAVFRAGRPAICVDDDPPHSVLDTAQRLGAALRLVGRHFVYAAEPGGWRWADAQTTLTALPLPGIAGPVQLRNAAGVIATVQALQARVPVSEQAIRAALPGLRLPGRGERKGDVIFDVAHNAESVEVLARRLRDEGLAGRVRLVLGMLTDKPVEAVAETLAPLCAGAYVGSLPPPRGLDAVALAARAAVLRPEIHATLAQALTAARQARVDGEVIVVCGSFLTVAELCESSHE